MKVSTRRWELKVIAFLLSLLLWLIYHYGAPAEQAAPARRPSRAGLRLPR
jgi:YbbR domain-containing protein